MSVAIVGAGPVGLTLANLLGRYGVAGELFERNPTTVDEPRAIAIDAESLRTMQAIGLYEAVAADCLLGFAVDYVNGRGATLLHVELGQTPYGHAQQNAFDQPLLERALAAGLARFPHVRAHFGHTVQAVAAGADEVTLHGTRPGGERFAARAAYVVACDGGRSALRQALGIAMRGRTAPQRWLVLDTVDPHLADGAACRFFCDPRRPGMTLRKQHQKRRWEWMLMPGEDEVTLLAPETIAGLLAPHTRPAQVRIERACVYTFHSLVADRYRAGRVLLAGDAAHMMPPFAGQGMNGGIRDAANLAWKLAAVLRGQADANVLDSYEAERRPHVIAATALANRLGALIQPTSRWRAALRDACFAALNRSRRARAALERHLLDGLRAPRLRQGLFLPAPATAARALSGQMLVQPTVRDASGRVRPLDDVLGPWFSVLSYGSGEALGSAAEAAAALDARLVTVTPRGAAPAGAAVEDHRGALGAWIGGAPLCLLVRPDRFCAAQGAVTDAAAMVRAFAQRLHAPPTGGRAAA